jgi:hypothetical protein
MTVNEGCPICQGRCCEYGIDDYRGAHRSEAFHTCPYCTNGTKPPVWAAEQERAAVVAWLRREATDGFVTLRIHEACAAEKLADCIERGEHRREEVKP